MSENENEDMQELIKKVTTVYKKYPQSSGNVVYVSINTPGKITRFKKKPKEEKQESKNQSVFLIDESISSIRE